MQNYISIDDLTCRFGSTEVLQCNDPSATGLIDETMLNSHINQCQAEIDFYLSQRYQTPITTDGINDERGVKGGIASDSEADVAPTLIIIVKIAGDLTRARYFEGVATIPEEVARAAKEARRTLEKIASGKLNIEGVPISTTSTSKENHVGFGAGKQGNLSTSYRGF